MRWCVSQQLHCIAGVWLCFAPLSVFSETTTPLLPNTQSRIDQEQAERLQAIKKAKQGLNTDKPVSLYQRVVTYLILTLFTVQPALANVVVSGSGNTSVETAANGVEVVNIATPNSKGLSHNKYQKFNVDPSGLVLNNSTEQFKRSELAGILQNNANLNSSGSASVILNEVTGANRSQLQGYTEVLGQSANVILTNPYGITCDGCGFINTPRVTLSTGAPELNNGQLTGFDVSQGSVTIEGLGLDATNQTYFDIISRTAEINANIHANDLSVITGNNKVAYQSNQVTEKNLTPTNKPALAIDSSSLGGMYAGRISLVATEEGVGVNVGNLAASQGNLTITADGKITLADASATQNIRLISNEDIVLSGQQYAGSTLSYSGNSISADNATIASQNALALTAKSAIDLNQSHLIAGVDDNGQKTGNGTLSLTSENAELTKSQLTAHQSFDGRLKQLKTDTDSNITAKAAELSGLATLGNDGQILVSDTLTLSGYDTFVGGDGDITADTLTLSSDNLTIDSKLTTQQATLTAQSQLSITNQGQLSSQDALSVSTQMLNQGGTLQAGGDITLEAESVNHTGQTEAATIAVKAESVEQSGALQAAEALALTTKQLTLSGENSAGQNVTINTDSLLLNGKLQVGNDITVTATKTVTTNSDAELLAKRDIALSADSLQHKGEIHSGQALTIQTTEEINNQSGASLTAVDTLLLKGDGIISEGDIQSGSHLTLTADSLALKIGSDTKSNANIAATAKVLTQSGIVSAKENVTYTSDSAILIGDMDAGKDISINSEELSLNSQIIANQDIGLTTNSHLTTNRNIIAGGDLTLTAASLTNNAQLSAAQSTDIHLTGTLTNQTNGLISGNDTEITATDITNHGGLQALNNLQVEGASLANHGAVVALNDATTNLTNTLTNRGVIYAGNDGHLYANTLNNYSDVLTQNDLIIAKNASNDKSTSLLNSSGTIESLGGDIFIYADNVNNQASSAADINIQFEDFRYNIPGNGADSFQVDNLSTYAPDYYWETYAYRVTGGDRLTFLAYKETHVVQDDLQPSTIISNKNLSIEANTLVNDGSVISGSNVDIRAYKLENKAYESTETRHYYDYVLNESDYHRPFSHGAVNYFRFDRTEVRVETVDAGQSHSASITATNNVTLNVTNEVNNSVIQSNAAKVSDTTSVLGGSGATIQTTQTANVDNSVTIDAPSITYTQNNALLFPEFQFPTSPNGLFVYSPDPKGGYLIETNPMLTNLGNFLGSDYFLNKIDYSPERDITFLGDAFYDTRIITQSIFEQTGRRYLSEEMGSDISQMQALIDAAATAQSSLDLSVGISLSPQQVAALTQDIIWYEEIEVNGQTVLAPKLYLAQVTQDNLTPGAIIAGNSIHIEAGKLTNSGTIAANTNLDIQNDSTLTNETGTLKAGGDTTLIAKGDISNISGTIKGNNVTVVSTEGSVINQTLTEQLNVDKQGHLVESDAKDITHTNTFFGDTATIASEGTLTIAAGNDITSIAGEIKGGDETTLQAGNDITFTSLEDKDYTTYHTGRAEIEKASVNHRDNSVASEGTLTIAAGNDITTSGGTITSNKDINLAAGGDVTLMSNETYKLDRYDASRKKDITSQSRQQGTILTASDNINIVTGGDTTLIASELSAEKDINIYTGGELYAIAADETDYSRTYRKSRGLFGSSTSDTEISSTTAKGTTFNADNITLISQGHQVHQASELTADIDIHLESTEGAIAFKAAEESESYRHETKKSGVMVKMQGEGHTSTTQKQTSMQSGGDISIASALGMEVDYVSTDNTLGKALAQIPANDELAWMAQLKDNPDVNWNEVNEAFDSWSYSEQSLSGPAAAIIAIALTVVTAGAGASVASAIGATGSIGSAVSAGTAAMISQAGISLINNGGDIGATLKELGSSDKMKVLATAMVTAGALAEYSAWTNGADINQSALASGNPNYITPAPDVSFGSVANHMGESAIRAGIDTAINNTNFADSFTNSLRGAIANDIGAIAANKIGDLGLTYDLDNGGITKTTLHGISQGVVAELAGGEFEAGAAAGIATELTGDLIGNIEDRNTQVGVAGLIGATAGVIATGDAEGAYTGQSAGQTVHQFNHLNHTEKVELELAKVKCNSGDDDACNRRDELNRLDYERDQTLRVACSVGSAEECNAQIEFAQENYASYGDAIHHTDDITIGKERYEIDRLLAEYDPNYPEWDKEGMVEFGYSMLTEPEGVMLCMAMTSGSCSLLVGAQTTVGAIEITHDVIVNQENADYYKASSYILSEFIGRKIMSGLPVTPLGELGLDTRNLSSVIINKLLDDNAKEARQYDEEHKKDK